MFALLDLGLIVCGSINKEMNKFSLVLIKLLGIFFIKLTHTQVDNIHILMF